MLKKTYEKEALNQTISEITSESKKQRQSTVL